MEMQILSVLLAFWETTQIKAYLLFQVCCFQRLQHESFLLKKILQSIFYKNGCIHDCKMQISIILHKNTPKKCPYKANVKRNMHTFREM